MRMFLKRFSINYPKRFNEISLVFFVDLIDDSIREKYEIEYVEPDTKIKVYIVFIACEA